MLELTNMQSFAQLSKRPNPIEAEQAKFRKEFPKMASEALREVLIEKPKE